MSEREILFRGKRVDNGEWAEGGFIPSLNGKRFYIGNMFECVEIVPETRSEYTGLTTRTARGFLRGIFYSILTRAIKNIIPLFGIAGRL